ncbi:MAG: murein L,D-transpeptidase [Methyloceanibacter sp.]|jgi:murein L,D-transpeptidase YafK|nr:murein L,D-transpeptidase [Methyloceanibacter sp.]
MLRFAFNLILLLAIVGAGLFYVYRGDRQFLDRARINATREAYSLMDRFGMTLPGTPDYDHLDARLAEKGVKIGDPVLVRIFKLDSELELWMEKDGRYVKFATYPICRFSGRLGPKIREGDNQAPEGFYTVAKEQLNPNSRWHRSFNLGYPNAFDRAHERTGSLIMVHGGCLSVGCFAITNAGVDEVWRLVTAALDKGQPRFAVQVFPFRMTDANLAARKGNRSAEFWTNLKTGYDLFETTQLPPVVSLCDGAYAFEPGTAGAEVKPGEVKCPGALAEKP